jgi:hypothetical protein
MTLWEQGNIGCKSFRLVFAIIFYGLGSTITFVRWDILLCSPLTFVSTNAFPKIEKWLIRYMYQPRRSRYTVRCQISSG